ncbi:hypothetical protein CHM34_16645 [Paludifilum halophilum]|uniref:Methyltransferase type 11 domain-containing protein n=2 Tax=Paludifilum halophilum TaxID=1642702 RepID=A0A235B250_9BACL|nr:hypothetical protein CHM34_16645 [Paludifilum halophilum]
MASNFLNSEVHRMSPTIRLLHEFTGEYTVDSVCDVACGAGHLAISFHERAQRLVGVDPSPNMLSAFINQAREKGVEAERIESSAERIPLPDDSFDLVVSRLAPHHFEDIGRAVKEMGRLARPGGRVAVIDLEGYENPDIDEFNHTLEVLHDPTHVRSYRASQWKQFFVDAGLDILKVQSGLYERPSGVSVRRWCEIASSGEEAERKIQEELRKAPKHFLDAMGIDERDGTFYMPIRTVLIMGQKLGN